MDAKPAHVLRRGRDSSLWRSFEQVADGHAHACVSGGNTGALMATGKFVLKMLPGIDRPAIIAELPSLTGSLHMLDLGANTEATPEQLFQFAVVGGWGYAALMDASTGEPVHVLAEVDKSVSNNHAAVSADGSRLSTRSGMAAASVLR